MDLENELIVSNRAVRKIKAAIESSSNSYSRKIL